MPLHFCASSPPTTMDLWLGNPFLLFPIKANPALTAASLDGVEFFFFVKEGGRPLPFTPILSVFMGPGPVRTNRQSKGVSRQIIHLIKKIYTGQIS